LATVPWGRGDYRDLCPAVKAAESQ